MFEKFKKWVNTLRNADVQENLDQSRSKESNQQRTMDQSRVERMVETRWQARPF